MGYASILDSVPWGDVGLAALQTFTIYWILLLGLRLVGRRVFAELGPQDLILLLLVAEACDIGLTPEDSGYWGTLGSVATLLVTVAVVERIPALRKLTENKPVLLYKNGRMQTDLKSYLLEEEDLNRMARLYGLASYEQFETLILEDDGSITGIVRGQAPGGIQVEQR